MTTMERANLSGFQTRCFLERADETRWLRTHLGGRGGVLLSLLMGGVLLGCNRSPPPPPPPKTPEVVVTLPVEREVEDYVELTGRTEAVKSVEIRARVAGYLNRVNFEDEGKEGKEVKKDEVLCEIDPRTYQAELQRAEASLAQTTAHLKRLKLDRDRAETLWKKGAISREDYDKAQFDVTEAEAGVALAEANRDVAKLNLEFTKVKSPFDGQIGRRLIDIGNLVKADDTQLTTIVALDPIYAYFEVDERTSLQIRRLIAKKKMASVRESADVKIDLGLLDEVDKNGLPLFPHKGKMDFVDNRLDAMSGTLRLRAVLPNPGPNRLLAPGMFVRVRRSIGELHPAILVPERALGSDQGRRFLYVVSDANRVEKRWVNRVGVLRDGLREILEDEEDGSESRSAKKVLQPGERVIVAGLQRVRPGDEVVAKQEATKEPTAQGAKPEVAKPLAANPKPGEAPTAQTPKPGSSAPASPDRRPTS
jgi:RND family efflux transporter MFP subunit